jgi:hypothetical protein
MPSRTVIPRCDPVTLGLPYALRLVIAAAMWVGLVLLPLHPLSHDDSGHGEHQHPVAAAAGHDHGGGHACAGDPDSPSQEPQPQRKHRHDCHTCLLLASMAPSLATPPQPWTLLQPATHLVHDPVAPTLARLALDCLTRGPPA